MIQYKDFLGPPWPAVPRTPVPRPLEGLPGSSHWWENFYDAPQSPEILDEQLQPTSAPTARQELVEQEHEHDDDHRILDDSGRGVSALVPNANTRLAVSFISDVQADVVLAHVESTAGDTAAGTATGTEETVAVVVEEEKRLGLVFDTYPGRGDDDEGYGNVDDETDMTAKPLSVPTHAPDPDPCVRSPNTTERKKMKRKTDIDMEVEDGAGEEHRRGANRAHGSLLGKSTTGHCATDAVPAPTHAEPQAHSSRRSAHSMLKLISPPLQSLTHSSSVPSIHVAPSMPALPLRPAARRGGSTAVSSAVSSRLNQSRRRDRDGTSAWRDRDVRRGNANDHVSASVCNNEMDDSIETPWIDTALPNISRMGVLLDTQSKKLKHIPLEMTNKQFKKQRQKQLTIFDTFVSSAERN